MVAVRNALTALLTAFSLHHLGDEPASFSGDLWLVQADAYLEPHVRSEVLEGWISGAKVHPVLTRAAVALKAEQTTAIP